MLLMRSRATASGRPVRDVGTGLGVGDGRDAFDGAAPAATGDPVGVERP